MVTRRGQSPFLRKGIRPRSGGSGDAQPRNRADAVRIESGQFGEMATTRHVIAVGTKTGRARRQQHHPPCAPSAARASAIASGRSDAACRPKQPASASGCSMAWMRGPLLPMVTISTGGTSWAMCCMKSVQSATVVPPTSSAMRCPAKHSSAAAGVRRGADRIVDVGQAIGHADALQAVRQRAEILHRRCQRHRVRPSASSAASTAHRLPRL